jgi:hypothetical protein
VPRKMPTVTQSTPRLPQNAALQPAMHNGAATSIAFRSANMFLRWTGTLEPAHGNRPSVVRPDVGYGLTPTR